MEHRSSYTPLPVPPPPPRVPVSAHLTAIRHQRGDLVRGQDAAPVASGHGALTWVRAGQVGTGGRGACCYLGRRTQGRTKLPAELSDLLINNPPAACSRSPHVPDPKQQFHILLTANCTHVNCTHSRGILWIMHVLCGLYSSKLN